MFLLRVFRISSSFFFFEAEDCIRARTVTGVQTCALPIFTRDRISAICNRGARPFTVWDTGGIFGAGESELSLQVRRAAEEALRESDLLLLVVDAKEGLSPVDEELGRTLRKAQKPILL